MTMLDCIVNDLSSLTSRPVREDALGEKINGCEQRHTLAAFVLHTRLLRYLARNVDTSSIQWLSKALASVDVSVWLA